MQTSGSQVEQPLLPIHVGTRPPAEWDDLEAMAREAGDQASPWLKKQIRPAILTQAVDWAQHGVEPRWLGTETSDCGAAVDASIFSGNGADELDRFLAGAAARGDVAVLVMTMGNLDDDVPRSVLARYDGRVNLRSSTTGVSGRRLPAGATVRLAGDVDGADRDLGVRLQQRPAGLPWWSLHLTGYSGERAFGELETVTPEGTLVPILLGPLDEPVVAYWESPDRLQRWYIVPAGVDWNTVLDWLVRQLLPDVAPHALRRVRWPFLADPELMTPAERRARAALDRLDVDYQRERRRLDEELAAAGRVATPLRDGLLFGTGDMLKTAVAEVLRAAGCTVVDLDQTLGGTRSADLLVSYAGRSRLVEVKSAPGRPAERLVDDVRRHLTTWPELGQSTAVDGGALVVNHDHRLPPSDRPRDVYTRAEFVASLTVAVVSSRALYEHWSQADWSAIRSIVFGEPSPTGGDTTPVPRSSRWSLRRSRLVD